jgi:hypothetical protein
MGSVVTFFYCSACALEDSRSGRAAGAHATRADGRLDDVRTKARAWGKHDLRGFYR